MIERVLVTGANGFIGSAVTRALLRRDYPVRAMVRAGSRLDNLRALDVEIVHADLRQPETLAAALRGCSGVFHVAADYRLWAPRPRELYATNVRGTRNLLHAAARAGVRRVVHTSSVATLGRAPEGEAADERTPLRGDELFGAYKRSKFLAERVVLRADEQGATEVVVVNPSAPVGGGDLRPTPTGRMIVDAARGRMPAYVDGGLNIVHVDDVAAGHVLAYERGRRGRRYVLGGEDMSLRDILGSVARLAGRHPPWLRLRHDWLVPAACLSEAWARASGRVPALTRDALRLSRHRMYCSSARAVDELGYRPRPARDGLEDAVRWFRAHGYC